MKENKTMERQFILFKRNFTKLHNQEFGVLLEVLPISSECLTPDFIDYDTDGGIIIGNGDYLLLTFRGSLNIPFTTIRKANQENIEKYSGKEGTFFKIVIEGLEK